MQHSWWPCGPQNHSGGFKNQQCQQRQQQLTWPLKILLAGPPPKQVNPIVAQASRSKGTSTSGITGGRAGHRPFYFCFSLFVLKPLKFVLGLPKWKFHTIEGPHRKLLTESFSLNPVA